MPMTHEPWLVRSRSWWRFREPMSGLASPCRSVTRPALGAGCCLPARRSRSRRHLGDAFRRNAGRAAAVSGRLSGASDAAFVSRLRDRGRRGRLCGKRRAADGRSAGLAAALHGPRHRLDALHRDGGASCERTHDPRSALVAASIAVAIAASGLALCLAAGRRPPAADPFRRGARLRDRRHALHGDGRLTVMPHAERGLDGAPALSTDLLAIVVAVVAFAFRGCSC